MEVVLGDVEVMLGDVGGGAMIYWRWCDDMLEMLEAVIGDVGGGDRRCWR